MTTPGGMAHPEPTAGYLASTQPRRSIGATSRTTGHDEDDPQSVFHQTQSDREGSS